MSGYSKELVEKTIRVWQPYSLSPLTLEDAQQIISSFVDLAKTVSELEKKYDLAEN